MQIVPHDFWDRVAFVISFIIIVLNTIQIAVIMNTTRKLTNAQMFIINLSVSDFLLGLSAILLSINQLLIQQFPEHSSIFLDINEVIRMSSYSIFRSISVCTLVAITIDRLFCVIHPIRYKQKNRRYVVLTCVSIWVGILLMTVLNNQLQRDKLLEQNVNISTIVFSTLTISTITLMMLCYAYIWFTVRKQNKLVLTYRQSQSEYISSSSTRAENKRISSEAKLRRLSIAILITFAVCYLPGSIHMLLVATDVVHFSKIPLLLELSNCNSFINTLVYLGYLRKRIARKFRNNSCCGKHQSPVSVQNRSYSNNRSNIDTTRS